MQITIINLASQPARWSAASRQFLAAGLEPVRQEAIEGSRLRPGESARFYCEALNARSYHRALRPEEIACYASHMRAWRALVDSGAPAMAIFEDDVEVDADLAQVLEAVGQVATEWDVVKLIGRTREKIRALRPLHGERQLVRYRRVPSLTAAYVVSAEGAARLLARRLPFGRPVDVDMRYWWECELRVLGVHPYPVRVAPSARISTIGLRRSRHRLKKLWHQALYTWHNWHANRIGAAASGFPDRRPAVPKPEPAQGF